MNKAKIAFLALVCASGSVFADTTGSQEPAAASATYDFTAATDGSEFVVSDFKYTLSSNVGLGYSQNETAIAVGTYNTRGRNAFTGTSEGGSVAACGDPTTGSTAPSAPTLSLDADDANGCGA
ncbi:hypothetical protein [Corticibacter populi]|uniref:hypothetical protein n=1 Tax=Corticibacter populi TaxID=1550736 RepID=UPI00102B0331|nr:hypothetical protein [Corticibacter populi]RZS33350.1 hypothetical protein EV687_1672 [Corticibacter populi]